MAALRREGRAAPTLRLNSVYGAVGFVVPTLVVLLAYPVVLRGIGAPALGVYLLASTLSGSFSFLEFGLTTVTTKLVAERLAIDDRAGAADVVVAAILFYAGLGLAGGATIWALAPTLARWSGVRAPLLEPAVTVLRLAAVQLPLVYLGSVWNSVFKGLSRFDLASAVATATTALCWGGAAAVAARSGGVVRVAAAGLAGNALGCAAGAVILVVCSRARGVRLGAGRPRGATLRGMFRFGGFMSVNALAGLLTGQLQNWLIAATISAAAVTVFATASQVVGKINVFISSTFEVMVPLAAGLHPGADGAAVGRVRRIYARALVGSAVAAVAGSACLALVAPWLMALWLRSPVASDVAAAVRILCLGLAVNGATPIVYHFLNGVGRPEVNTGFMVIGPFVLYGILGVFALLGPVTLLDFAWATSLSLVMNGLAYIAYCERVVWRRLLVRAAPGGDA